MKVKKYWRPRGRLHLDCASVPEAEVRVVRNGLGTPLETSPQNGKYCEWEGMGPPQRLLLSFQQINGLPFLKNKTKHRGHHPRVHSTFLPPNPQPLRKEERMSIIPPSPVQSHRAGGQCLSLEHSTMGWNPAWKLRALF